MPITAAFVETNGWVLAIDRTGAPVSPVTNFGAYTMDPDGAPRVALSVASPGFVKSGGQAVAGSTTRTLIGTRPMRKPIDPLNPAIYTIDETDLGGGVTRVRIALSEEVYTGDTGLTLAVLAGWYDGETAASGLSVTNNSTLAAPVPVMRWVLPPYELTRGAFRVSLIVGTVNPVGFEPVAGVKFTATDGTTVKTIWATALATDNSYGDSLRCYTVEFDPASATAFTAGLIRVDAEVYPWVGAMRTTDAAGTRTMTGLRTTAFNADAASPWVIGYDPDGSRYGDRWVYVDPVNGTLTANAAMVATSLAGAKAVAPASRAKTISTAAQALYLQNRTLAAANGQASQTRSNDAARIVLAPGTHTGMNGTTVTSGATTAEIPVRIMGDPEDSNPRANVILNTSAANGGTRIQRMRLQDLTVQTATTTSLTSTDTTYMFLDNVTVQGASGSESSTTWPLATAAAPAGSVNWNVTRSKIWRLGTAMTASTRFIGLLRKSEISRRTGMLAAVKNRWIPKLEDGFTASNVNEGFGTNGTSSLGLGEDLVIAFNDMRSLRYAATALAAVPSAVSGVSPQTGRRRRHLVLNNIFERISGTNGVSQTSDTFFGYGEGEYVVLDTIVVEGNTFVGSGYNAFYCDPNPASLADTYSQTNLGYRIRNANNATDRNASKHDDFDEGAARTFRIAAGPPDSLNSGYRPVCVGVWAAHFGVNMEAHVDFSRSGTIANFRRDGGSGFGGLRSVQYSVATVQGYADDRSERSSGVNKDTGGGDYTPTAVSPLLGRIRRANSDRDWAGNARLVGGASGAVEATTGVTLAAENARSGQAASGSQIAIGFDLAADGTRQGHGAAATILSIGFTLVAEAARLDQRAGMPGLSWAGTLTPEAALAFSTVSEPAIEPDAAFAGSILLGPGWAVHGWAPGTPMLLPNSTSIGGGTLNIRADIRTITIS